MSLRDIRGSKHAVAATMSQMIGRDSNGEVVLSILDCNKFIGYFVDAVAAELLEKGRVEIRGLGVFLI